MTKIDDMRNDITISSTVVSDIKQIIYTGREDAYRAAGKAMVSAYWNIGKRIVEEEQNGNARADYGKQLINILSE